MQQTLLPGVQGDPCLALALCLVVGRDALAEGVTFAATFLGRFNTLDTTPALSRLGSQLAHFFDGVMFSAMVAIGCFSSHGNFRFARFLGDKGYKDSLHQLMPAYQACGRVSQGESIQPRGKACPRQASHR